MATITRRASRPRFVVEGEVEAVRVDDELAGLRGRGIKQLHLFERAEGRTEKIGSWSPRPDTGSWLASDANREFHSL